MFKCAWREFGRKKSLIAPDNYLDLYLCLFRGDVERLTAEKKLMSEKLVREETEKKQLSDEKKQLGERLARWAVCPWDGWKFSPGIKTR